MREYLVGKLADLPDGKAIAVEAGRRTVAVYRLGAEVFAIANSCPHKGASLSDGEILVEDKVVRCPWHHWNWRLEDGALEADRRKCLRRYDVAIDGDDIVLRI
jgi:nitrite reductase (NADH) small subunit